MFEAASSLFAAAREVDIKGWYEHDGLMGIIFAEISGVHERVKSKIFTKVYQALMPPHWRGDGEQGEDINARLSRADRGGLEKNGGSFDPNLYPDLSPDHSSKKFSQFFKRVLDVVSSLLALVILSPLLVVIAAVTKLTSKGPVLFRQERVGLFGKRFTFLKFRSMHVDCDQTTHREYVTKLITESRNGGANGNGSALPQNGVYKLTNDSRVTPVGRFLRKTSLDEFPSSLTC